jgi:iron complex outermembrane receptor protein
MCRAAATASGVPEPVQPQPEDQSLKKLSLEQLGSIEVTSVSKEPETLWTTAAAVYVLTADEIRRSGVTSVVDALRLVPGVNLGRDNANSYSVGVRGFENIFSKGLLVLIDGRSVYTTLFAGVYWDVTSIPLEEIDRIEVIRGPGGTVWGANAVNGVINIITRNSQETKGGYVSVGGGNVDQGRAAAAYSGTRGNLSARLYGQWFTTGPEFHFASGTVNNFDDWWTGRTGFRSDWNPNVRDSVMLEGGLFSERSGEETPIATFDPLGSIDDIFRDRVSGSDILLRWKRTLSETSDIQVQTYFDRVDRDRPQIGEKRATFDIDLVHHFALATRNNVIWGAGVRVIPDSITSHFPGSVDFFPPQRTDALYSGFVQDEIKLIPDTLSFTAGIKLEHNDYSGFEFQPNARILYRPARHQSFWAAVTRAVRTPSRLDSDVNVAALIASPVFLRIIGQPNFQSETLLDFEGGYRQLFKKSVYLDVAVFHNKSGDLQNITGPIVVAENSPGLPHIALDFPFVNGAAGTTDGVEISPSWDITPWLQLKGAYSYLTLDIHSTVGAVGDSVATNFSHSGPHHTLFVAPRIKLSKAVDLDPTYHYQSAVAFDQNFPVPAYHTLDLRLGWNVMKNVEFSVVGQNLLQPHHIESSAKPQVGIRRGAFAKLVWTR